MIVRYGLIDWRDIQDLDRYHSVVYPKPRVMDPLRKSVRERGFVNPVLAWATHGDIRVVYGQSRAGVARELDLQLPAVIADHDGRFPQYERLDTVEDIAAKWAAPDIVRPHILLSPGKKLWMVHHVRAPINDSGECF